VSLAVVRAAIVACDDCPRLRRYCARIAREKKAAHRDDTYWGRPVPGFGDPRARILLVGLAPAAHGGNRTGRIFTGDRSGDFLFAGLFRAGLANQPTSIARDDGLRLRDAYVAAVNRCAPPGNRPTPQERAHCLPFLSRDVRLLAGLRVIVPLGAFAWDGALRALEANAVPVLRPRPRFGHGAAASAGPYTLLGCFHPSQQNTFTGKLTPAMLDEVLGRAVALAGADVGA
jgi:uracil-DNA glycosylase family 4